MDRMTLLETQSAGAHDALAAAAPDAAVPACPGWDAADLAWHLTRVQWSFGTIVAGRRVEHPGRAAIADLPRERPAYDELLSWLRRASERLLAAFAAVPDDTPVWSFVDRETDLTWALRRQAHEALVHRIDAEQTAGLPVGRVAPAVAADGVHELLTELLSRRGRGRFAPSGVVVDLVATDTGDRWSVALGRLHRTDHATGEPEDRAGAELRAPVGQPDAVVAGPATPLHAWAWGRSDEAALTVHGDGGLVAATREALRSGT